MARSGSYTVAKYASLSLGYPFVFFNSKDRWEELEVMENFDGSHDDILTSLQNLYEKEMDTYQLNLTEYLRINSYMCEDIMTYCGFGMEFLNCCAIFKPILTNWGFCQRSSLASSINGSLFNSVSLLPLDIDLTIPENKREGAEVGFFVSIHDPRTKNQLMFPKSGFLIGDDGKVETQTSLRKTDYSAKFTRFFGLRMDCPTAPHPSLEYTYIDCLIAKEREILEDICNCTWILYTENEWFPKDSRNKTICQPQDMINCYVQNIELITHSALHCTTPCTEYKYDSRLSYARVMYINDTRVVRLTISFNSHSYFYSAYHRYDLTELFSDIGGSMGLLLGASVITGIELLILLGQWFYFCVWKN